MTRTPKHYPSSKSTTDIREQLFNDGDVGPVESVQLPLDQIVKLRGIMFDIDPKLLRKGALIREIPGTPDQLYEVVVKPWLHRHPVLRRAEVRCSGTGLHVIVRFAAPVTLESSGDQERWDGIIRAVQCVLPIDCMQPGATALTRQVGSINGKNHAKVTQLMPGELVPVDDVLRLFEEMKAQPFRTVFRILSGTDQMSPCPICQERGSRFSAMDHCGDCYAHGSTTLGELYDLILTAAKKCRGGSRLAKAGSSGLIARLNAALRKVSQAGSHEKPAVLGVTPGCQFVEPMLAVLAEVGDILVRSNRVFQFGSDHFMETADGNNRRLALLASAQKAESNAPALLANIFICESGADDQGFVQFGPPPRLVSLVFANEVVLARLPRVRHYARRPVFDTEFVFRNPGWHSDVGVLVHGPAVTPSERSAADVEAGRLPPRIDALLADFAFRSPTDRVHAVALLLTGLLAGHFVIDGKPVAILDGNQPGVGKTLLARTIGLVLDGVDPRAIHFTVDDEELAKRTCAMLRDNAGSLLVFDNARVSNMAGVTSAFLEANSMLPEISLRILSQSANITRPNDLLWVITMNMTRASADLVSRCLPIRFFVDGDPRNRQFRSRGPLAFAAAHREEILGELAGMVLHWRQQGAPSGNCRHRLTRWAAVIGGILQANGLRGFLDTLDEAAEEFNTELQGLGTLAEVALQRQVPGTVRWDGSAANPEGANPGFGATGLPGLSAQDWIELFEAAGLLSSPQAAARSRHARATAVGTFMSRYVDREVRLEWNGEPVVARLRRHEGASRRVFYAFELRRVIAEWTVHRVVHRPKYSRA